MPGERIILPPGIPTGKLYDPITSERVFHEISRSPLKSMAPEGQAWQERNPDPVWWVDGQRQDWFGQSKMEAVDRSYAGHPYQIMKERPVRMFKEDILLTTEQLGLIAWLLHFRIATSNQFYSIIGRGWIAAAQHLWTHGGVQQAVADRGTGWADELTVWRIRAPKTVARLVRSSAPMFGAVPDSQWAAGRFPGHEVTAGELALRLWENHFDRTATVTGEPYAAYSRFAPNGGNHRGDLLWQRDDGQEFVIEIQRRSKLDKKYGHLIDMLTETKSDMPYTVLTSVRGNPSNATLYNLWETMTAKLGPSKKRWCREKVLFAPWEAWFPLPTLHTEKWENLNAYRLDPNGKWETVSLLDLEKVGDEDVDATERMRQRALPKFHPAWVRQAA